MEIVSGPQTAPNATIGGSARFECIIDSDSVLPWWNINGYGYTVTHLPDGFYFENNFHSKMLIINPVQQEMNNTIIYCYLVLNGQVEKSTEAKLIIQSPTPIYYSSQKASATCDSSSPEPATTSYHISISTFVERISSPFNTSSVLPTRTHSGVLIHSMTTSFQGNMSPKISIHNVSLARAREKDIPQYLISKVKLHNQLFLSI